MANGMGSLYIGSSGLRTSQNALNTTANNLANVDTTGYVRQKKLIPMRHLSSRLKTAVPFLWQSIRLPNRTLNTSRNLKQS